MNTEKQIRIILIDEIGTVVEILRLSFTISFRAGISQIGICFPCHND